MALTAKARRAAQRRGSEVNDVASAYTNPVTGKPLSGKALLAKLFQGESGGRVGAVSSAGARGTGQFMPGTRQAVLKATGGKVDPWRSEDDAARAAVLHLKGKLGHRKGLEGYNPGGGQDYVNYILRQKVGDVGGGKGSKSSPGRRSTGTPPRLVANTTTTPGVDNSALRQSLKLDYLQKRGKPGALLSLATGLGDARDTPATKKTTYDVQGGTQQSSSSAPTGSSGGNPLVESAKRRADKIDKAKVPYKWGGGHGAKVSLKGGVIPMDCSGAVSAVLGINPRVSGQFEKFGSPGAAPGGKGITIYANPEHVLMQIDGRFWGTSKSNPGGGAGWIPASKVSKEYLSRFTVRHMKRSAL